jgi:transposase-like protein
VLLLVIAGMGYRRVSWLLEMLFHVTVSRSSLQRWVGEVAAELPSADEIIERLNAQAPISEGHLDEIFPRGMSHGVLVLKDEHGRILGSESVERRDETSAKNFLMRFQRLGISFRAFYTDGYQPYYKAIRAVFGNHMPIQYDYFHIIQNAWRHLRKAMVAHRREVKKRADKSTTPWYKAKLQAMAKQLWEQRFLVFKAAEKMTPQERGVIDGVWAIFEDSEDETQARHALEKLKRQLPSQNAPKAFTRVVNFLENHFTWMTAFLRHDHVKRNSLAESGMRVLRRLEQEHDGFRSDNGRENFLRIYQAIKYLGWSVYDPPDLSRKIGVG